MYNPKLKIVKLQQFQILKKIDFFLSLNGYNSVHCKFRLMINT